MHQNKNREEVKNREIRYLPDLSIVNLLSDFVGNFPRSIEEWADERGLAISALKSTITLFTPQFAQSSTNPQVTLNNSILPLERTPYMYTGSNLRSSLQIQCPWQIFSHPDFTPYQHHQGPYWYQLGSTKGNHTYHLYVPYPVPFHICSSFLVPQHLTVPYCYSETTNYLKLCSPQ